MSSKKMCSILALLVVALVFSAGCTQSTVPDKAVTPATTQTGTAVTTTSVLTTASTPPVTPCRMARQAHQATGGGFNLWGFSIYDRVCLHARNKLKILKIIYGCGTKCKKGQNFWDFPRKLEYF